MAASSVVKLKPAAKSEVFRFFISYAREDEKIAIAVCNALQIAMGPSAEVFIDSGLRFGVSFQEEIRSKLDETDTLVVVDSSVLKPAFAYPGMELGFFISVMERDSEREFPRRIVPIYLQHPPDILAGHEGIKIGISHETLALSFEQYESTLDIDYNHPTVKFLREFQDLVDSVREKRGATRVPRSAEQLDLPGLVKKMQLAVFSHLKNTAESTVKPEKQLVLKTNDEALHSSDGQLPDDATLIPVAGNPLSIFGLQSEEMSWTEFQQRIGDHRFHGAWTDAITSVINSSLQTELDVDNSQVIVSQDGQHTYRVILTTGTKYFNGVREFSLYFVQSLKRADLGDQQTTFILKALELFCRFRFLFLERNSKYSSWSFRFARTDAVRGLAREMERDLNLLQRDGVELGLDQPNLLGGVVDWAHLLNMVQTWRPLEEKIRQALAGIRRCTRETVESARESMVAVLQELETAMQDLNGEIINEMAEKLKKQTGSAHAIAAGSNENETQTKSIFNAPSCL